MVSKTVNELPAATRKAVEKSKEFFGFFPRGLKTTKIEWPTDLVIIGAAAQLNYVSDKFDGKMREYFHRFDAKNRTVVLLDADEQPDGSRLLILKGHFKVDDRGLIG